MSNSTDNLESRTMIFQFIDHQTGKRSEPFSGNYDTITKILDMRKDGEAPLPQDYILLVAVIDGKDTNIPGTPLITVESFQQYTLSAEDLKQQTDIPIDEQEVKTA